MSMHLESTTEDVGSFKPEKRRWLILAIFCIGTGLNEFMWNSYSPIYKTVSLVFGVDSMGDTLLASMYFILFLPGTLLFSLFRDIRIKVLVGFTLQAIGAVLRYVACEIAGRSIGSAHQSSYYGLLLFGQSLAALASPVWTNLPAQLSLYWQPENHRAIGTIIAVMSNPIGNALGSALPAVFVPKSVVEAEAGRSLARFSMSQMIVALASMGLAFGLFQSAPRTPPSAAAAAAFSSLSLSSSSNSSAAEADTERLLSDSPVDQTPAESSQKEDLDFRGMLRTYRELLRNYNFIFLMLGFGLGLAVFNGLLPLMAQLMEPCGYSEGLSGISGGVLLGSGLFSSALMGVALRRSHRYLEILKASILLVLSTMAFWLGTLLPNTHSYNEPLLLVASAVLGASVVPLLPLSLENAAECTFPLPADASAGLLTTVGKYGGAAVMFAVQAIIQTPSSSGVGIEKPDCSTVFTPSAAIYFFTLLVAAVCILLFKKDYRRLSASKAFLSDHASTV